VIISVIKWSKIIFVRFEILVPYSLVEVYHCFRRIYYPSLQGQRVSQASFLVFFLCLTYSSTLKMEVVHSKMVNLYHIIWYILYVRILFRCDSFYNVETFHFLHSHFWHWKTMLEHCFCLAVIKLMLIKIRLWLITTRMQLNPIWCSMLWDPTLIVQFQWS
jgi:hypothetical protein